MHTIRLTPLEEDTGTRLDSFLSRRVEGLTRSAAARLLAEGCVTCDGAVPGKSYRIAGGGGTVRDAAGGRGAGGRPAGYPAGRGLRG